MTAPVIASPRLVGPSPRRRLRPAAAPHDDVVRAEVLALVAELAARLDQLDRLLAASAERSAARALGPELVHYRRRLRGLARHATAARGSALADVAALTRAMLGLVAGVEGAVDWHSPTRRRSGTGGVGLVPAGGTHDYQRDRCPVVGAVERAWVAATVDRHPSVHELRGLACASGMAAMATVLAWLAHDLAPDRAVLVPATSYHETRLLLERSALAARVRSVPDVDPATVLAAVDRWAPGALVLDVQANGPSLELADVGPVLAGLAERWRGGPATTVLVDTTMLGVRAQPFADPVAAHPGIRLVTVQSLTKFAQLGLDRVAAGLVVAHDAVVDVLDDWREHLGANATAAAARQLPAPDRGRLEQRWLRHEAGATALAAVLRRQLDDRSIAVVHPADPDHPSAPVARRLGTTGATVALVGPDEAALHRIVARAVPAATRAGVPVAEGTSFGFDATRLSVIVPDGQAPFLRVAPGAGPRDEAVQVGEVLAAAVGPVVGRA